MHCRCRWTIAPSDSAWRERWLFANHGGKLRWSKHSEEEHGWDFHPHRPSEGWGWRRRYMAFQVYWFPSRTYPTEWPKVQRLQIQPPYNLGKGWGDMGTSVHHRKKRSCLGCHLGSREWSSPTNGMETFWELELWPWISEFLECVY